MSVNFDKMQLSLDRLSIMHEVQFSISYPYI